MAEIAWQDALEHPVPDGEVERAVRAALAHGGRPEAEIAVTFVTDEVLRGLHAEHLGDPTNTDVIAFDLGEDGEGPAGELYVSVERASRVASVRGVSTVRELLLYVVHGVLHLCGFDDGDDESRARMRAAEASVMQALGFDEDLAPHEHGTD